MKVVTNIQSVFDRYILKKLRGEITNSIVGHLLPVVYMYYFYIAFL